MTKLEPQLAIVVKGWPRLSETFIAQELVALERSGLDFEIWSLRHPTDKKTHPLHDQLLAKVIYLPEYLHQEPRRVLLAFMTVMLRPNFFKVFTHFLQDWRREKTRNRVRRFG